MPVHAESALVAVVECTNLITNSLKSFLLKVIRFIKAYFPYCMATVSVCAYLHEPAVVLELFNSVRC